MPRCGEYAASQGHCGIPHSQGRIVSNRFVVVLIALAPIGSLFAQAPRATTDVPVAKVVLFSSGVGYFEHAGSVRGNGATELRFKTSQINDILKSIMLQDQDGGRVGAITYPSQDPIAKTLKSFQVDITSNPSLAALLNQLRGAHVTIQSQAERLSGTVLGVETRRKSGDKESAVDVSVLNLLTGATIRAIELQSVSNLTLDDAQLQDELTKALAALTQARDQDKKPVTINFTGSGDRRVRIGYVVETPIWKTSYRLLLDAKGTGGALQGWAIVENQTESDWNGVSLSLVSGRPLSFIMDLYQPLYATRPTVVPELFAGLHPQLYEAGFATDSIGGRGRGVGNPARRLGYGPDGQALMSRLESIVVTGAGASANVSMDAAESVRSMATTSKLGELFQYTVGNVTLARQKSAMLPIITDSIELERLSIYNASVLATNPLNGARLRNTTGKHLLQGPVTVLDAGSYAGDARIDNVPPGQERYLSYGIDLDVLVSDRRNMQTSTVTAAAINKGMLTISRKLLSSQEYVADNKATRDKTLIIEHPVKAGWTLVDTQKPVETTSGVSRFKVVVPAGKLTTLIVKEEVVQAERLAMASTEIGHLEATARGGAISPAVRAAIVKAIQLKQAALDVERIISMRLQQITEITAEQGRIRENMKTVAQSTPYYERLLTKLNEQESAIEKLQKERVELTSKRETLRAALEEYLNSLTVG